MSNSKTSNALAAIPEGYAAIPISQDQKDAVLKICALVRCQADPVGGHLVMLRDMVDAKVFLGCVVDTSSQVHEWLEIWIQNTDALAELVAANRQSLSNAMLDDRWRRQFRALEQLDEAVIVKTGWEAEHPLPTYLDISMLSPIHPMDVNSASPWKLCTDEGLLQQKNLPSYNGSLHRYLYLPANGAESHFVPVTQGAPTNDLTKPLSEICPGYDHLVGLNPQAGLILVKKHAPIGLETFIDIINGTSWDGLKHGKSTPDLGAQISLLKKDEAALTTEGWLLLDTHGRCGRLVETFHLKLRLLADLISSVHSIVRYFQSPLLNISPDSWHIKLGEPGRGLPVLWTARAQLGDPGNAIPLAIEKSDVKYYLPAITGETSIYRPLATSQPTKGRASIRIREVLPDVDNTIVVEGTFATHERIETTGHDLAWQRLNLASGDINLYSRLEADSAMAPGEWRFRTIAQSINDAEISSLQAAKGIPMPDVPFSIIPLLSSPCDLYSLAVLAVRILLVDNTTSLPVALDTMLSLARQVEADYNEFTGLDIRIKEIFDKDKRWPESLGPQHLNFDKITAGEAFSFIPSELWWTTLAIILRMFPGMGPDSECRDYGDARQGGLHKVFERTITDLDKLILRTRSLIVADWKSNKEIVAVIQKYLV